MFVMKCSILDISHAVGVVSGHMVNPEHWKWTLQYLRGTRITYSVCSDLVCGAPYQRRDLRTSPISAPSPRGSDTKIKYTRQTNTVRLRSLLDIKRRRITSLYRKRLSRVGYMQTKRQLDN
jgi:hypothetical protein